MTNDSISQRKADHLSVVLNEDVGFRRTNLL